MGPNTGQVYAVLFSIIFLLYIKNEWGKSFTGAIRAESTLRDQTGLLAWWPLWDTTCLFLSHESRRASSPSEALRFLPLSQMFVNKLLRNNLISSLPPFACVRLLWDTNFLSELVVPHQLKGSILGWGASVFHWARPLTTSHDSYFTANTVGLWLHSSGNGLHKKEVNPHVGTRPGLGMLTLLSRGGFDLPSRTPSGQRVALQTNWV